MEMRINELTQTAPAEAARQTTEADGAFKFVLASHIDDAGLQEKINALMNEISEQGKKISKKTDVRDMKRYRQLIKEFINEIVYRSHEFSRENFLDRRGRHRVYGIIRLIDKNLDDLAAELIKDEKDNISILNLVGEIRGLLLDIIT